MEYSSARVGDDEQGKEPITKLPFYKLFSFADSKDKLLMAVGTVGAICHGLTLPVMSVLCGEIIDAFGHSYNHDVVSLVSEVLRKFISLAFAGGAASFLHLACWMVTGERQAARIRSLYLRTILQQEIAYFDREVSTGEVTRRMSGDTILIQNAMGERVGKFVEVVSSFLGGFMVAFAKGWLLTLVLLSSVPLLVTSGGIMFFLRSRIASRAQNSYANAATLVHQTVTSIRTVSSFCGEKRVVANYRKLLNKSYKSGIDEGFYSGLGVGSLICIMFCTYALAVWFGAKMILHKGYTGGEVFTVLLAVVTGSSALGQASCSMAAFTDGQAAAFKLFETINRKSHMDVNETNGKIVNDIRGEIELKDVYFSYPSRPKERIFNGFSLFIPSGLTTALVGESGSGKSTVINLIERFYDPRAGKVLIDGIDLRAFQLKWIRSKIGLVSQEPALFPTSIKDNIAYGKEGATIDEIIAAAELANAYAFIDKLPEGMDTKVGENGIQLSGGQKQRIAIARAILKDPRILLLDEATSALDVDSEKIVQDALENVMGNRTTVVVAHRLCTVRNANMIGVLRKGKLVEKGTHFQLLTDPQGVYSNLIMKSHVENKPMKYVMQKCGMQTDRSFPFLHPINLESHGVGNTSSCSISISKTELDDDDITHPEESSNVSIYRLAHLNKPEALLLAVGAIFAIITGAVLPVFGLLLSSVAKTFYETPHELNKNSRFWALMLVTIGLVSLVAYPLKTYFFGVAGNKLIRRIRLMCFEKIVNTEVSWFDEPENLSGKIGAQLSFDATIIRALVGDALAQLVEQTSSLIVGLAIAFEASWELALIILAMIPLIGFIVRIQVKSTEGFSRDAKVMYSEATQVASDAIGNIRTVVSFCTQEKIMEMFTKKCERQVANGTKQGVISGTGFGLSMCLLYLVYSASFYAGALLVQHRKITMLDVFRVLSSLTLVAISISSSSSLAPDSSKARTAVASIFSILDRKSKIDPSDASGMTLENVKGKIKLSNVNFRYPIRPDVQILSNLSLTIQSGKIVALVGETGSGKSTVISLLQRFYDPDSGKITLDGIDIRKFQVKWLRRQMGLVSQEPVLFNETIRANIAYGKEGNATEREIIGASKLSNAHEFINGLQQGYDTIVGERGIQLSGGQKQRIAIARAIVKRPKILLLDEATSALDVESEKIVQKALDRVMSNRTTIVVAHRLSTIKGANVIVVMKNGSILEKGDHDTLKNIKGGIYSSQLKLHMSAFP